MSEPVLTRNFDRADSHTLRVYRGTGGYAALEKAKAMEPAAILDEVKRSNLRGLGGAGFPTGMKWSFIPKNHTGPVYLVINADEGEPGTFKDRTLMEKDPHRLIEGCIIAMWALGAHKTFIYVRCELALSIARLESAIAECKRRGYLGPRGSSPRSKGKRGGRR